MRITLWLIFVLCSIALSTGIQLICNTKDEICSLKSPALLEIDEVPLLNFTFLMESPESVTHIRFENSEVGEIPKIIFERFVNLQVLDLKFCALKRFRKATLENAHNLTEIDLSYNKLKRLEENLFSVCQKLVTLNLFRNTIIEVNEKAFSALRHLEKLVLSSNEIRRLRQGVFRDLPSLTELDLKKNRIEDLGTVFLNLTQLEILELSFNKIRQLSKSSFVGLESLEILDLSNNRIETVESDVFESCLELEAVNLANNKLKDLNLKMFSAMFKILDVSGNALTQLNVTSGLNYAHKSKTSVNADNNLLGDFSMDGNFLLTKLSLAHNNFSSLDFMENCCLNLTWIDISHNPLAPTKDDEVEEKELKTLLHLTAQNITYQRTTALDNIFDLIAETPDLQTLDVSDNSLKSLDWTLLPKLSNLTTLTVKNCSIGQIDGLLSTFPNLMRLNFDANQINCDNSKLNGTKVECHN